MGLNKDFKVKNSLCVNESLNVAQSACIGGDASIYGNLSVYGDETVLRTIISTTSALSVINHGTGPALYVRQAGSNQAIAEFVDKEGGQIIFDDAGHVGIGTSDPQQKLTVIGGISAIGLSAIAANQGFVSAGRDLADIFGTGAGDITAVLAGDGLTGGGTSGSVTLTVSAGDGVQATANCVSVDSTVVRTTGAQSIGGAKTLTDDLTVSGSLSSNKTITAETINVSSTTNGFISAGRNLGDIFITAATSIDGSGTADFLPAWSDSNTLTDSIACQSTGELTVVGNVSARGLSGSSACIGGDITVGGGGDIFLTEDQRIYFEADDGTWIEADSTDRLRFVAGSKQMLLLDQDTGDRAVFGFGTKVGINVGNNATPNAYLTVAGDISANNNLSATGVYVGNSTRGFVSAGRDIGDIFTTCVGDVTEVVAGTGLTGGGDSGSVTLNVSAGDGVQATANCVSVDSTVARCNSLNTFTGGLCAVGLSALAANRGFISAGRDLTDIFELCANSVDGSGTADFLPVWSDSDTLTDSIACQSTGQFTVAGNVSARGLSASSAYIGGGALTVAGNISAGGDILTDSISATKLDPNYFAGKVGVGTTGPAEKLTVSGNISANKTITSEVINVSSTTGGLLSAGKNLNTLFSNCQGTVTSVTGGTGIDSSGGTTPDICVDSTVVRTTGAQSISGAKTLTDDLTISSSLSSNETITSETVHVSSTTNGFISAGRDLADIFTTCVGDITEVVAGTGLTGGGASGSVTVNVSAGDGVQATANCVSVDSTVVRTTGAQSIAGAKCFSDDTCFCSNVTGIGNITLQGGVSATGLSAAAANQGFISAGRDLADIFATSSGNVDGSGTANVLPVWSDTDTLTDSIARQSTGQLTVGGNVSATGGLSGSSACFSNNVKIGNSGCFLLGDNNDFAICRFVFGDIQLKQNIANSDIIMMADDGYGNTVNYIQLDGGAEQLVLAGGLPASAGEVGIGINPTAKLHLPDSACIALGDNSGLYLNHDSSKGCITNYTGDICIANAADNSDILLQTDDGYGNIVDYIKLDGGDETILLGTGLPASAGNVGIGETSPQYPLHICQSGAATLAIQSNGNDDEGSKLRLIEGSANWMGGYVQYDGADNNLILGVHADNNTTLSDDNPVIIIPRDTGKVGIGTSAPGQKLTVAGNISANGTVTAETVSVSSTTNGFISAGRDLADIFGGCVTGSGTTCYIAQWHGSDTINNAPGYFNSEELRIKSLSAAAGLCTAGIRSVGNNLTVAGSISAIEGLSASNACIAGNIDLPDAQIRIGVGDDLVIQHDGANSYITEQGTGDLYIQPNSSGLYVRDATSGNVMIAAKAGSGQIAELYAGGDVILRTAGTGINIVQGGATVSAGVTALGLSAAAANSGFVSAGRDLADIFSTTDGDITEVVAGAGLTGGGASGSVTLNVSAGDGVQATANCVSVDSTVARCNAANTFVSNISVIGGLSASSAYIGGGALTVAGNISAGGDILTDSVSATKQDPNYFAGAVGIGTNGPATTLHIKSANPVIRLEDSAPDGVYGSVDGAGGSMVFDADRGDGSAGSNMQFRIDNDEKMRILSSGEVGIGSATPDQKLTVAGNISAHGALSASGTGYNYFNGRVGIGTTEPEANLEICSNLNQQHLYIQGSNDSVVALARIKTIAGGSVLLLETGTTSDSRDILKAKNSSGTVLNLQADGKLGIGIETPTEKLTVAGNISAQGGLSAHSAFLSGSVNLPDDAKIQLGNGNDLEIYHNGSHSYISDTGTGNLNINASNLALNNGGATKTYLLGTDGGSVQLRYNDSTKIETTNTGANIIGELSANGTVTAETVHVSSTTNGFISAGRDLSDVFTTCVGDVTEVVAGTGLTGGGASGSVTVNVSAGDGVQATANCVSVDSTVVRTTGAQAIAGAKCFDDDTCFCSSTTTLGNATIQGNLSVTGDFTRLNTIVDITSALEIVNHGSGPGLLVNQTGSNTVLDFQDDGASVFKIVDGGQSYFGRGISAMNGLSAQGGTAPILFGENDHGVDVKFFGDTASCFMHWDASQNRLEMPDDVRLVMGTSADSSLRHVNDCFIIENGTGDIHIQNVADNGDVFIKSDDGYGGCVNYIALDGGEEKILLGTGLPITAGEVGIGHPDPTFKLHVSAASSTDGIVLERGGVKQFCADGDGRVDWGQNLAYGQLTWDTGKARILGKGANALTLGAGGTMDYVYISGGTGNVGIGTTAPAEKLTVAGNISATGYLSAGLGINVPDSSKITLGDAHDLELWHNGSVSYVRDVGTGGLHLQTNGPAIYLQDTDGNAMAQFTDNGNSFLYSNHVLKFNTTNTGACVYGGVSAASLSAAGVNQGFVSAGRDLSDIFSSCTGTIDGSGTTCYIANFYDSDTIQASPGYFNSEELRIVSLSASAGLCTAGIRSVGDNLTVAGSISTVGYLSAGSGINVPDSSKITAGNAHDLQIYHDGSNSYINETGTGDLYICGGNDIIFKDAVGNLLANMNQSNSVELYYGGSKKFETTNTGVDVTGTITSDGLTVKGGISADGYCSDYNNNARFGTCALTAFNGCCNVVIGNNAGRLTTSIGSTYIGQNAGQANTTGVNTAVGLQALNANTDGTENVAVGVQAMLANDGGYQNVAVGVAALQLNTEGLRNVAVGCGALLSNTTGDCNVGVGCQAGYSNQTGNSQVAIGSRALYNSTVGENIAVGACALEATTTGVQNVAMGHRALDSNTIGKCNTAIGFNTLYKSVTACGNVAVGNYALYNNTCGEKNVAIGNCALQGNTLAWYNVAVGHSALHTNTTGEYNVAVGRQPLNFNTTGNMNIAIGRQAMYQNTDGQCNTAVGTYAMNTNTEGDFNQAFGHSALYSNKTGHYNNAMGYCSLYSANSGEHNNAFGFGTLHKNYGGHYNTAIGRQALACNTTGCCNEAIGYRALYLNTTGCCNVAIGRSALCSNTTGCYNVGVGACTLFCNTSGHYNTAIGVGAVGGGSGIKSVRSTAIGYNALFNQQYGQNSAVGYYAQRENTTGYYNTSIGDHALEDNQTGHNNTAVGWCALHENEASNNTAVGMYAALCNTTGTTNAAMGFCALRSNTTADSNVAIGPWTLFTAKSGGCNVGIGECALYDNWGGVNNVAIGRCSLRNNTTGSCNVAFGNLALKANTTGGENVAAGYSSLEENTTGYYNIALGTQALKKNTTASYNIALNHSALRSNTTGSMNIAMGYQSLYSNISGNCNIALGRETLNDNYGGDHNIAMGMCTLRSNTTGDYNTGIGACVLKANTTGSYNVGMGCGALNVNTTGQFNTALGEGTLGANTTGDYNVGIGGYALDGNTTGEENVAIGRCALKTSLSGDYNVAMGTTALYSNYGGCNNTAIGQQALYTNTTGCYNTGIGFRSLRSNTTGNYNVALGGTDALYNNTTGESNIAIGRDTLKTNTEGDYNVALGNVALCKNVDGDHNQAIGGYALFSNTEGNYNAAIGNIALCANTTGDHNQALGQSALRINTTGCYNTAIGNEALYGNTTGLCNVAIGRYAMQTSLSGDANIAIGPEALCSGYSGCNNIAIGCKALEDWTGQTGREGSVAIGACALASITTACGNTAIGHLAAQATTNGDNVAIGTCALYANTGGEANVAIGFCASKAGTSSRHNVGIGFRALDSSTSCGNIAIGYQAAYNQSSGHSNVFVGCRAGYNQSTGDHIVAVGHQAGYNSRGDHTTAIGSCALYYSVTGTNSVAVGTYAGQFLANGMGTLNQPDNSTYLGACTRGSTALDENTTVIGYCACSCGDNTMSFGNENVTNNYFNGNIIACATDPRIRVDATAGNHPGFELLEAGSRCWIIYNDPDNTDALTFKNDADRVVIDNSGYVGIGITNPGVELTVAGEISASSSLSANEIWTNKISDLTNPGSYYIDPSSTSRLNVLCLAGYAVFDSLRPSTVLTIRSGASALGLSAASANQGFVSAGRDLSDIFSGCTGTITGVVAGTGLTGGGSSGSVTVNVSAGDGVQATANCVSVDSTVVRTTGAQSIAGAKCFSSETCFCNDTITTGNATIQGNLSVTGEFTRMDTIVDVTSAMEIQNRGTGPALTVNQAGSNTVLDFQDDGTSVLKIKDGGQSVFAKGISAIGGLSAVGGPVNFGEDDIGIDVKFNGDDTGRYALWDASSNAFLLADHAQLRVGCGSDLRLYHTGDSYIRNYTGSLNIENEASGQDISIKADNGYGTATADYIRLDSSEETVLLGTGLPASAGYVGIGTTDPEFKLTVNSNIADQGIRITSNNGARHAVDLITESATNGGGDIKLYAGVNSVDSRFRQSGSFVHAVCTGSNFGVGTCAPAEKLTVAGNISAQGGLSAHSAFLSGSVNLPDTAKLQIGNSNDLELWNDGSASLIDNNVSHLYIRQKAVDQNILFQADNGSGTATTYFKLDGNAVNTCVEKDFRFADNVCANFGTGSDFRIKHDGSHAYIQQTDGDIYIQNYADNDDVKIQTDDGYGNVVDYIVADGGTETILLGTGLPASAGEVGIHTSTPAYRLDIGGESPSVCNTIRIGNDNNGTALRIGSGSGSGNIVLMRVDGASADGCHDGNSNDSNYGYSVKYCGGNSGNKNTLHILSDNQTGTQCNSFTMTQSGDIGLVGISDPLANLHLGDSKAIGLGNSADIKLLHNGTTGYIQNFTGDFRIEQQLNDGDMEFYSDDGSGSIAKYFYLDGGGVLTRFSKRLRMDDSVSLQVGSAGELDICHNGTDSSIINSAAGGHLCIQNNSNDDDICFINDNGYGGNAAYLVLDGGEEEVYISTGLPASAGNVGIGTTSPNDKLTVAGSISAQVGVCAGGFLYATCGRFSSNVCIGGNCILFPNDAASAYIRGADTLYLESDYDNDDTGGKPIIFQTAASEKMRIHGDGNVGIGVTTPGQKLTISGNISAHGSLSATGAGYNYFNSRVGIGTATPSVQLDVYNSSGWGGLDVDGSSGGEIRLQKAGTTYLDMYATDTGSTGSVIKATDHLHIATNNSTAAGTATYFKDDGTVGIGTTAPSEKLTVAGNISAGGDICVYDDLIVGTGGGGSITVCGAEAKIQLCDTTDTDDMFMTFDNGGTSYACLGYLGNADFDICTNNRDIGLLPGTANVGIGETAPGQKLTVSGNISAHGSLSATGTGYNYFASRVAIGCNLNPAHALHLPDDCVIAVGNSGDMQFQHSGNSSYIENTKGHLYVNNHDADCDVYFRNDNGYGGQATYLQLDGGEEEVYISAGLPASAGNVGIGTTSPNEKLTVAGNISATGTLSAGGPVSFFGGKVGISNSTQTFDYGGSDNETALHLKSSGDVALILEADTDNSGESDNPKIKLIQDGGAVIGNIFMNGNNAASNRIPANAMVMGTNNDYPVAITQNNYAAINITDAGCVAMGTCAPDTANRLTVKGNISASGAVCSPHVCGCTTVCAPAVCGTTSVYAPLVCGTNCVMTSCMIASTCTIACASNYYIDNGGYSFNFGQGSVCHQLMYYGDMYYCNLAGHVKFDQDATDKDIIFCGDKGSGKYTFVTMDMSDSILDVQGPVKQQTAINAQTGTTYQLVLADHGKLVTLNNGSAITLTIPPNSTAAFPTGTEITLTQLGAGQVTIAAGSGVTAYAADAELKTRVQYSSAVLTKIASDTWLIAGDLTA